MGKNNKFYRFGKPILKIVYCFLKLKKIRVLLSLKIKNEYATTTNAFHKLQLLHITQPTCWIIVRCVLRNHKFQNRFPRIAIGTNST
jgi:hypothetical protein